MDRLGQTVSKQPKLHATHTNHPKKPKKAPFRPKRTQKRTKKKQVPKKGSPTKASQSKAAQKRPLPKAVPRPGTPEFYKLQQLWYKKAAQSGFRDIESINPETGNSYKYLNTQSASRLTADKIAERQHYYRRWSNFLVHNPRFSSRPIDLDMARMWADGATWAEIKTALRPKYGKGLSDWSINKFLKEMDARVKRWNKVNREGLDFEPQLDLAPD